MTVARTIAIDGPAASGKSTLGKRLADALGYLFFDTGLMYRAITWAAIDQRLDILDAAAVTALAERLEIDILPPSQPDRNCDILVGGCDITWEIRRAEVDANVSIVSAYPGVRQAMTLQQRRIGKRGQIVMVGRDIGTVVMPDADVKIYLDASAEVRARRRYTELIQRGLAADLQEILDGVRLRDQIDSTRAIAPLRPAEDAAILDSDQMDLEQVFAKAMTLVMEHNS